MMKTVFGIFIFMIGICVGSFLNVVVLRLEKSENLGGRSYCPKCKHSLAWFDLIPVLSFLFLWGKCRYCGAKISIQYPIIEMSTALIFLLIFNFQFLILNQFEIFEFLNLIFLLYVASSLIVIFAYDLRHYLIPDKVLFPAIVISIMYRIFEILNFSHWNLFGIWDLGFGISGPLLSYPFAAVLASGFFLTIYLVSRGRWMGFGDVKLAVLLGLILGFPNILVGLFLAFFIGAILGIALMILQKRNLKSQLPFAPFLIFGTFLAMFWGQGLLDWYISLLTF